MLAPSPVIKATAKTAIKPCFLKTVVTCSVFLFIFYIVELIASTVSVFADKIGYFLSFAILCVFVIFPAFLGLINYFKRLLWGQNDSVLIIFKYFSSFELYKKAMHFTLLFGLKFFSVSAILFSPCIVIWLLSNEGIYSLFDLTLPVWASNLWALNSFVVFLSSMAVCFYMIRYYLAVFIFVANDSIEPAEVFNMSHIISKRTGGDFFGLVLSFAPWILLSVFVAPLVFTLPYFMASYGVHCRFAIAAYNRDVDHFNSSTAPSFSTDEI